MSGYGTFYFRKYFKSLKLIKHSLILRERFYRIYKLKGV